MSTRNKSVSVSRYAIPDYFKANQYWRTVICLLEVSIEQHRFQSKGESAVTSTEVSSSDGFSAESPSKA
jgi:hypothetical protein